MEKLVVIRDLQGIQDLLELIKDKDLLAVDTETTGVEKGSEIIGFSVSFDLDSGYYVVTAEWLPDEQRLSYLPTKEAAPAFMEALKGKQLVMHNAIFDCMMIRDNYGVDLMPSVHTDTLILAHLLDENRHNGLKELGVSLFGETSTEEQKLMKASVTKNGGQLTKACYELYKADSELIGRYGAKDTLLTFKIFYTLLLDLYDQGLDTFFYDEESMPLLRGPTYELNSHGLKVDLEALEKLKKTLEADILEGQTTILHEIKEYTKDLYPGTTKKNHFNLNSNNQVAWLLFEKLGNEFLSLTDAGKDVCEHLGLKRPYSLKDKRAFISAVKAAKDRVYAPACLDKKTGKMSCPKKVKDYWTYTQCNKDAFNKYANKYKWVKELLKYNSNSKLLETYVQGIQDRVKYGIIRPNFLQHGTTSGRYSCKNPNFQNLPKDDKRVKACIVARPGNTFVGADYSQLEPRVFASVSGDLALQESFAKGQDFYSVVGAPVFGFHGISLVKDEPGSFASAYPQMRQDTKAIALAIPYGTVVGELARKMGKSREDTAEIVEAYWEQFPSVHKEVLATHEQVKRDGFVKNLYGRPRRLPYAKEIAKIYGKTKHAELPYEARTVLNLAFNHRIQSTGASIMNRASILFYQLKKEAGIACSFALQIHDEVVIECREEDAQDVKLLLKHAMETAVELPGVGLVAEPAISNKISTLK